MAEVIGIIFPHQLFFEHELLKACARVYLVEEHLFFKEFNFHKMKIAFHRASMRAYYDHLATQGIEVNYIDSADERSDIRILIKSIANQGATEVANYSSFR